MAVAGTIPLGVQVGNLVGTLAQAQSGQSQRQNTPAPQSRNIARNIHNFVYGIYFGEASMNGEGTLLLRNGDVYTGTFVNDHINEPQKTEGESGQKHLRTVDNKEMRGEIRSGTLVQGDLVYTGNFKDYLKSGQGYEFPIGWEERLISTFVGTF